MPCLHVVVFSQLTPTNIFKELEVYEAGVPERPASAARRRKTPSPKGINQKKANLTHDYSCT